MIDGIPVRSPSTGAARTSRASSAGTPYRSGRAQIRSAQRAKNGDRCSPECTQRSARRSTRLPSPPSTAGSSVSVAASTNTTATMIPSAIDRNAGLGTSITADSEISTVTPLNSTALPAVSIATPAASAGARPWPKWAAR